MRRKERKEKEKKKKERYLRLKLIKQNETSGWRILFMLKLQKRKGEQKTGF